MSESDDDDLEAMLEAELDRIESSSSGSSSGSVCVADRDTAVV